MNKGRQWVEGSIHNSGRIVWDNNNVFWTNKFICDILNNNEWNSIRLNQHQRRGKFYW